MVALLAGVDCGRNEILREAPPDTRRLTAVVGPRKSRVCRDLPANRPAAPDWLDSRPDNPGIFSLRQDTPVKGFSGTPSP